MIEDRFEQLISLDLIDLPEDFYDEKPPFDGVDHLERKLKDMEETNLNLIGSCQENRNLIEIEEKRYEYLRNSKGEESNTLKVGYK